MTESFLRKAFTLTAVILSLIALSTAASWCSMASEFTFDVKDYINSLSSEAAASSMIIFFFLYEAAVFGIMFTAETAITAAVWGILGFNSINKYTIIEEPEYKKSLKVFKISSTATLAAALIIMIIRAVILKSGVPFLALLLCWQNSLFMWVFYVRRLKKRCFPEKNH